MSRDTVLARGRLFLIPGLVDTCIIDRITGQANNVSNGQVVNTYTTKYSGACRMKMGAAQSTRRVRTVGEEALRIATAEIQLPVVGSEGILADDRVRITASLHDIELIGLVWAVVGEHHATHATTRRLALIQVLA